MKVHLRIELTNTDEDGLIQGLLDAAVQHVDGFAGVLGRALMQQTWTQDFDCFGDLCLPLAPVISVVVTYYDLSNSQQTLASSVYSLLTSAAGPVISLNYGQVWPSVRSRQDAVRVTFVSGYPDADSVPAPIKAAIALLTAHWYANREAVGVGNSTVLPLAVDALLAPFRRVGV